MGLLHRFTSRVILNEFIVHIAVASVMFALILPFLERSYKAQFLTHVDSETNQLTSLLVNQLNTIDVSNLVGGHITAATLIPAAQALHGKTIRQDAAFNDSPDQLYHTAVPLHINNQDVYLQLAYDEEATINMINLSYRWGIFCIIAYILLSMLMTALLGPLLTKPLQRIGAAARNIASGQTDKKLNVRSHIYEIQNLATDLEHMRAELIDQRETIAARETRISNIVDNLIEGLITVDEEGLIQSFNSAAERIFGCSSQQIIQHDVNKLFVQPLFQTVQKNKLYELDRPVLQTMGLRANGEQFHMEVAISELCELDGCLYIVVCRDITDRKLAENEIKALKEDLEQRVILRTQELATVNRKLQYQALHDTLTELPNRALLHDRLQQSTRVAKRSHNSLALMILDLDRFKEINDTLGHHCGDLLLQEVAKRIRRALRNSDTVARLGGDEFAVLLPAIESEQQAVAAAEKIAEAIASPFQIEDQHVHVGSSIGIAMFPRDGEDHNKLMRRADVAMYVAKRTQKDYAFYDSSQDSHSVSRLAMVGELRHAIAKGELEVYYQPKASLKTRRVLGAEALVRWNHPSKGLVMPSEFIAIAEHTGLIKPLTIYVLDKSLQQIKHWLDNGEALKIAVNLSARSLQDTDIVTQVANRLAYWKVPSQYLRLEITESTIMEDPIRAMDILKELNDMGIQLSIDDFGTGYSSLMYLKQLPINQIKIDQSFVCDMLKNTEDRVIVRSTIDLAHNMGHKVIAEGVNDEETLDMLSEMGCDMVQGYFISRPMPATQFEEWLATTPWSDNLVRRASTSPYLADAAPLDHVKKPSKPKI